MKKILIISILYLLSFLFGHNKTEEDLIISTYNNKNAIIEVETTEFENNSFRVNLDVNWVNKRLRGTNEKNTVLAIDKENIVVIPAGAVSVLGEGRLTEFSNDTLSVGFYANPRFEGGEIEIQIPLVSAEDLETAQTGYWQEVLYSSPKKISIKYFIDGDKIIDLYPPEIIVTYPTPNKNAGEEFAFVEEQSVMMQITVQDKGTIQSVKINGRTAEQLFTGEYQAKITLYTGLNTIKIEATDNVGNKATLNYELICTYQYEIDVKQGIYYAILIGVSDYDDPQLHDLAKPILDARALRDVLIKDYTFEENYVFLLENPTNEEIIQEFEDISEYITTDDNLLIFYAGHGYWDAFREIGYWLPSNAEKNSNTNWIRNSTIKDYIGSIRTRHTLLITDACFSGSIFQTRGMGIAEIVAYQKIYDMPSRKGMTSGTLKEVPDESVFLNTLIKRLEQNENKYLPCSDLFNSLRDAVINNTPTVPQYGTIQGVGDEGGEFIFIKQ